MIITGSSDHRIVDLKHSLNSYFHIKDMGLLHYFLGLEVLQLELVSIYLYLQNMNLIFFHVLTLLIVVIIIPLNSRVFLALDDGSLYL